MNSVDSGEMRQEESEAIEQERELDTTQDVEPMEEVDYSKKAVRSRARRVSNLSHR